MSFFVKSESNNDQLMRQMAGDIRRMRRYQQGTDRVKAWFLKLAIISLIPALLYQLVQELKSIF